LGHNLNWCALGIIFTILFIGTIVALPEADAQLADTSSITVHTVDSSGEIFGYYTVLSQGGVVKETGFSAATFTVNNGETYNVGVQDSGDLKFDHWQDTGSTIANRDISITSITELFAVYRNITDPSPSPGTQKLIVRTVNSSGEEIFGYWTVLLQSSTVLQTGFSAEGFIVNNGENYEVSMGDYNGVNFDHWEDGSTDNPRTFSLTSDKTFTAYYNVDDTLPNTEKITGKLVGIQKNGKWKSAGPIIIGENSFKATGSGTYQTSGSGNCKNLTGSGTLVDGKGNSININFEGQICSNKPLIKGTIPFEITGGTGKYQGKSGNGDFNLNILGHVFGATLSGELVN
jgi:hypothetical protein